MAKIEKNGGGGADEAREGMGAEAQARRHRDHAVIANGSMILWSGEQTTPRTGVGDGRLHRALRRDGRRCGSTHTARDL